MTERKDKVELLAPAGGPEAFYGAVRAGADAVYLGGSRFGARAYAENFTQEELTECIRFGKLFGVKVYLTVNTLLRQKELEELPAYLEPFYLAGLDGVIVQDLGVLRVVRERFPGLAIHASTQMTLVSAHGARLLKEMGACRIVPARELSLEEIAAIRQEADIELETFIHGAMCYCYSGQCLFSSILGGRSGNRGRCAQPCRLPYEILGGETGRKGKNKLSYPLSLKDMCTIDCLPALIEAGIDSFKIEGRMKKPEYAAGVTAVYRRYLDLYYDLRRKSGPDRARKEYRVREEDRVYLSSLYIRSETQDGYYFRRNGPQMITLDQPAYSGSDEALLARIRKEYLEDRPRLPVEIQAVFRVGEPASVTLRRGSLSVTAIGERVERAQKQPLTEENIRKQLQKLGDSSFRAERIEVCAGEDIFFPLKGINELRRSAAAKLEKKLLESLKINRPDWSIIREQYRPNQSTKEKEADDTIWNMPENTGKTECFICTQKKESNLDAEEKQYRTGQRGGWTVALRTMDQMKSLVRVWQICETKSCSASGEMFFPLRRIYIDGDLLLEQQEEIFELCRQMGRTDHQVHRKGKVRTAVLAALPYVLRREEDPYLDRLAALVWEEKLDGFLVRSLDGIAAVAEYTGEERQKPFICSDAGVYVWNDRAAEELSESVSCFCLPYELNASQQRELLRAVRRRGLPIAWEKIIYGRIPMMITAGCVAKTAGKCLRESGGRILRLRDRYRAEFPVLLNCRHCSNILYNALPFALPGAVSHRGDGGDLRLDFTIETGYETERILRAFWLNGKLPEGQYTSGHERRGVE